MHRNMTNLLTAPIITRWVFLRQTVAHWLLRVPSGPSLLELIGLSSEAPKDSAGQNRSTSRSRTSFVLKTIRALRNRRTKRPEDKAFALYGILRRFDMEPAATDYKIPLGTIYHDLYRLMLNSSPELLNLLIDAGAGSLEAPSWVPDWSTLPDKAWLPEPSVIDYPQSRARSRKPKYSFKDRGLAVSVSWKGTISLTSGAFPLAKGQLDDSGDDAQLIKLCQATLALHNWLKAIKEHGRVLRPYEDISFAVFNTLFAEKSSLGNMRPQTSQDEARAFDEWYSRMLENFPEIDEEKWSQQHVQEVIQSFLQEHALVRDFVLECCKRIGGRRSLIFLPTGGIGVGPPGTLIGDKIAAIDGVSVPLILREVDDQEDLRQYQFVGCAYISHLVEGLGQQRDKGGNIIPVILQETGQGTGDYVLRWPEKLKVHRGFLFYRVDGNVEENTMTEYGLIRKTAKERSDVRDIILV